MEEKIIVVAKCNRCERMWDMNGCQASGRGPFEVIEFVCDRCQEQGEQRK